MTQLYTRHFSKLLDQRVPKYKKSNIYKLRDTDFRRARLKEREEIIERHVDAAIEITKGIRDFDGREAAENLPNGMRLNLIIGGRDKLVPRELEMEFFDVLRTRNVQARFIEFPKVGHMVPTEAPFRTFQEIDGAIRGINWD